jgi:hypothetical protein
MTTRPLMLINLPYTCPELATHAMPSLNVLERSLGRIILCVSYMAGHRPELRFRIPRHA